MNTALNQVYSTEVTISVGKEFSQKFIVAVGDHHLGYHDTMRAFQQGKNHPYVKLLVSLVQARYPNKKVKTFMWNCCDRYVVEGKVYES